MAKAHASRADGPHRRKSAKGGKKSYHHGDLRRALLDASIALIEQGGVEALSLREVARAAGVSSAAPYHHFATKSQLLGAIAGEGFLAMRRTMDEAILALADPDEPIGRLSSLGNAYVAFALRHPTEFRLMFRPGLVDATDLPPDCEPGAAFELLIDAVGRLTRVLPAGLLTPEALTVAAWSLVHGAAVLVLDGPLAALDHPGAIEPSQVGPMAVRTLTTLLSATVGPQRPITS